MTPADSLDVDFYRTFYPDLAGYDDAFLVRHFEEHGRREGRLANRRAFYDTLPNMGRAIPADFDPSTYRAIHRDVDLSCRSNWDAIRHYATHGAEEGRRYTLLDPVFYWQLYRSAEPFDLDVIRADYERRKHQPEVHASAEALLAAHDLPGGRWLDLFSAREFSIYNFDWIGRVLNRAEALRLFVDKGIDRLAKFNAAMDFDPSFYRELHPDFKGSDRARFMHWLTKGLDAGERASPAEWLAELGFDAVEYPPGLAWRRLLRKSDAAGRSGEPQTRWTALKLLADARDLASEDVPLRGWPTTSAERAALLVSLGKLRFRQGAVDAAIACLEKAAEAGDASPALLVTLGMAHHAAGHWEDACIAFARFHATGASTLRSVLEMSESQARLHRFEEAFDALALGRSSYGGVREWRSAFSALVERLFAYESDNARDLLRELRRADADALMMRLVARIDNLFHSLIDLPTAASLHAADGPVVILADLTLPQCKFYRVDQKIELFEHLDRPVQIFPLGAVEDFLAALPAASAAIFYRTAAFPQVIRAIASARSQAIPTFYEVDDLIFDSAYYPEPFEFFGSQMEHEDYINLLYGVPLFRAAMALCDAGIASTPALADHMAKVVRTGRTSVVRNGFDSRSAGAHGLPSVPPRGDRLRIAYGSATLAHSEDFNTLLAEPLCALLAANPSLELVIVGYLELAPAFSRYRSQIVRVPLLRDPSAFWHVLAGCDINLAVLFPGVFNDCKSEIKWLEAALLGIPSIVSGTETYREVITNGHNGFLAADSADWAGKLRMLVEDRELRARVGTQARFDALALYNSRVGARALDLALTLADHAPVVGARKPRILVVNVFFPPQSIGGATRVVSGVADRWIEEGATKEFDFAIATSNHAGRPAYSRTMESYRGLPVFRVAPPEEVNMDWRPFNPEMRYWFADVLRTFEPDLVHFHCVQRLTASVVEACAAANIPYLVSAHDAWWVSDYQFLFDEAGNDREPGDTIAKGPPPGIKLDASLARQSRLRALLDGAERIMAPSESFAELYRRAGFKKAVANTNGVPALRHPPRRASSSGRVRLGHIGNTVPHKGFDLVEAALRQNRFANLELLALDHAFADAMEVRAIWGATPVHISAPVSQDSIGEVYADLDVLLAPSTWTESFGLVTREAHAAGLWVIASDRGAIGEDVCEGVDGFVVDVSSPVELARVLARMNEDPARFRKPVPARRQRTVADQAAEILCFYREVLGANRSPAIDHP